MDDILVITLKKAVTVGEEIATELNLREPIVKEFESFQAHAARVGQTGAMKILISTVTGFNVAVIEKIGARDFMKASNYLNSFFEESPATGDK